MDAHALIVGGGCAGLSLGVHVVEAARRAGRACPRVEIVEPREVYVRDRTWCGWRFGEHPFTAAVSHRWQRWAVQEGSRRIVRESVRHPYECIPADAFYRLAQERLGPVQLRLGTRVTAIVDRGDHVAVETSAGPLRAAMVFDARPEAPEQQTDTGVDEVSLLQHFVGWEITAPRPCFDPGVVEMMDFAVSQARGLHFMYMLPFSDRTALVEATYISPAKLAWSRYEHDIQEWLRRRYGLGEFEVGFHESGQIPMSTRPARPRSSPRVIQIGLRGGLAKPSTGYAFAAIQEFSAELAARIVADPNGPVEPPRARNAAAVAMDRVFLSYLDRHPGRGPALFADLFEKLPPDLLCRFLTDHGSPLDGLRVMAATPLGKMTAEVLRSRARWLRRPAA